MVKRLSILLVATLLAGLFMSPAVWGESELDRTLNRGLRNNGPYANSLVTRGAGVTGADKAALLHQAIRNAPNTPSLYFKLALAVLPNLGQSAIYVVDGVKAYANSYWWLTSLKGLLYISLLLSILISAAVIVLIRLPRQLPRLVHDINENKVKLLIPLLLIPVSALGPIVFLGALMLIAGLYMEKSDKWLVYMILIFIVLTPLTGRIADGFYSASNPEMRAIVDVNEGRDNIDALRVLGGRKDFASRFSYATALKREGGVEQAVEIFNQLANESGDHRAWINLGNAYFAVGDTVRAKSAYKKALGVKKTVLVLYNLSKVYGDSFDYASADKYYEEAQALDMHGQLSEFQAMHSKSYNRMVLDATMDPSEIGQVSGKARRALPLVGNYMMTAAGGFALLILFGILDSAITHRSYFCAKCHSLACDKCSDPNQQHDHLCNECLKAQVGEDTSAKARLARMLEANEDKNRVITRLRVLSVAPPGLAQAYSGHMGKAFWFMIFFLHPVVALLMNPYFTTGLDGGKHGWLWLAAVPVIVLDYLISFVTVNRRLDRGWL